MVVTRAMVGSVITRRSRLRRQTAGMSHMLPFLPDQPELVNLFCEDERTAKVGKREWRSERPILGHLRGCTAGSYRPKCVVRCSCLQRQLLPKPAAPPVLIRLAATRPRSTSFEWQAGGINRIKEAARPAFGYAARNTAFDFESVLGMCLSPSPR